MRLSEIGRHPVGGNRRFGRQARANARARRNDPTAKAWVAAAVASQERDAEKQLWENEPTLAETESRQLQRIRLLAKADTPESVRVATRLQSCLPTDRCLSGACPECGRLLQRWFVRKSRRFIRDHLGKEGTELVALSIAPSTPRVAPGALGAFSIANLQRRVKAALDQVGVGAAIGGVDISFNEDLDGKYTPLWSVHAYLATMTKDRRKLAKALRRAFRKSLEVPRPTRVVPFKNIARRRSYALKMHFTRRVGHDQERIHNGKRKAARNTQNQRLRTAERIELFVFLDRVGLASRVIFRACEPRLSRERVSIQPR